MQDNTAKRKLFDHIFKTNKHSRLVWPSTSIKLIFFWQAEFILLTYECIHLNCTDSKNFSNNYVKKY